jgi:hypothetical protein
MMGFDGGRWSHWRYQLARHAQASQDQQGHERNDRGCVSVRRRTFTLKRAPLNAQIESKTRATARSTGVRLDEYQATRTREWPLSDRTDVLHTFYQ